MSIGKSLLRHISFRSATALVIANIIGAGIFTTTGFQAQDLGHPILILATWIIGGLLAFCGALCYAELGAALPHAGGEYIYLRETYGPLFGFMSAFVSLIAGFSAPIAAASIGFVSYAAYFFPFLGESTVLWGLLGAREVASIAIVWLLILIHFRGARGGVGFNDWITLLKVAGIAAIILGAAAFGNGRIENFVQPAPIYNELGTGALMASFGNALIFVIFCYSGWNASAYVVSEMKNPQKDLPRSLLIGTAVVIALYLGLNAVYFYGVPAAELAGEVEVGLIASRNLFGPVGVTLVTLVLCVSILASASAMTIAGPRVTYAFGKDFPPLAFLAEIDAKTGAPRKALVLQGLVTSVLIFSGGIGQIQQYAGFTLGLFSSLAVSCVLVLRITKPDLPRPFKAWGYPITPLLFLAISFWIMFWAFRGRPVESGLALFTGVLGGIIFYFLSIKTKRR